MTHLVIGKEALPRPQINFWLEEAEGKIWLVAKHSGDIADQRLLAVSRTGVQVRRLFTARLCDHFGIDSGEAPATSVEPTHGA